MQQYLSLSCRAVDAGANRHGQMRDAATLRKRDLVMKDFAFALPNHATIPAYQPFHLHESRYFIQSTHQHHDVPILSISIPNERGPSFLSTHTHTHTQLSISLLLHGPFSLRLPGPQSPPISVQSCRSPQNIPIPFCVYNMPASRRKKQPGWAHGKDQLFLFWFFFEYITRYSNGTDYMTWSCWHSNSVVNRSDIRLHFSWICML